jgi:polyisoprenoid-binding protein YceI
VKARVSRALVVWVAGWAWTTTAMAQPRAIDTAKSVMTVRVSKAGVLSAFGHNHEIVAPIAAGKVDVAAHAVELHVQARALQVRDPGVSDKDRAEIQRTMLSPEVLDAARNQEITFRSSGAEPAGKGAWKVLGKLTLHGQTRTVAVEAREDGDHYVGTSRLKLTEFGIEPVKVAGGTVKVKDEILIEFNIQLTR